MAKKDTVPPLPEYTKEQLMASIQYTTRSDVLSVILEDGKTYNVVKVDEMIKEFDERKVK